MKLSNLLLTSLVASTTMTACTSDNLADNKALETPVSKTLETPDDRTQETPKKTIEELREDDPFIPPYIPEEFHCPGCGLG